MHLALDDHLGAFVAFSERIGQHTGARKTGQHTLYGADYLERGA